MAETLSSILGGAGSGSGSGSGPDSGAGTDPRLTRRTFLKLGGVGLVTAAGGTVWWAERRGVFGAGQGPAYEPWSEFSERLAEAGLEAVEDPGLAMVMGGILAASPHNSQPWLFAVEPGRVDVIADLARNLGPLDPFLRELYLAQGCAVENLVVTAGGLGVPVEVRMAPDPDDLRLAASLTWDPESIGPARTEDPLFQAIPHRRTDRGPFLQEPRVPERLLEAWGRVAEAAGVTLHLIRDPGARSEFGALLVEATEAMIADPESTGVTREWIRMRPDEIQRERDGLTLDGQGLGTFTAAMAKLLPAPAPGRIDRMWLEATRDRHVGTADLFGILAVDDAEDRAAQVACGRVWQRMHLLATAEGVGMHPMNQVVERAAREEATGVGSDFGGRLESWTGRGRGLLCFRAGMASGRKPPSPRRGASQVLQG